MVSVSLYPGHWNMHSDVMANRYGGCCRCGHNSLHYAFLGSTQTTNPGSGVTEAVGECVHVNKCSIHPGSV